MSNCTTFLDNNSKIYNKDALIFPSENRIYTYAGILDTVNRYANILSSYGVKKGDRVCIYLPAIPEYLLFYFAIWRIGAISVPLNIVLKESEVSYMLKDSDSCAIITDTNSGDVAERASAEISSDILVLTIGNNEWNDIVSSASNEFRAVYCDSDDLCQLQYTSGTTGKQKGAMLTHGNWIAAMDAEKELLGFNSEDIYLGIYPMAHVGVSWGISALKSGATWIILERFELEKYISYIAEYKATVVAAMPPVIHSLLKTSPGTESVFACVREMISGGGPLHPSIWKEFYSRFGVPVVNAYGLSETIVVGTGTAIRPCDYERADEFRSVGRPVGYSEVKIVDVNDALEELSVGEIGEIALRGPAVAKGYWKMEEETRSVFLPEGWFLTGDIGYIDDSGMVAITDRKKDMIVMSGWKIYPTEVEKAMIEHPDIDDIAIFGCPDSHRGEIPVAAVVLRTGKKPDKEALKNFAKERLAGYKVPREYIFVDILPRVNQWKLLRRQLRDDYCRDCN
ncbi:long-chain fatty acid--CoA ligase [Methanoplanus sp. FWC-SCC4]|uniref:Long-chain fatty acid--CoA ligase n=1 Tax=Methanochimaera problematica TaxID=2609417 RepID=A0AA97I3N5_9EURY|nr:AMP-binding protein [Methanoplanus sp. FWC-SCC4]WOF15719.1 long-chain fatty acid--CoA ligase [Methanoplanus sp. FWC-SCC4]